uniref:NAD-dependent epimerase/dehydratase n=1 Tax=Caulobacter sp. (strain K31) TaxID=366602 RepID=B0T986_CAUSK
MTIFVVGATGYIAGAVIQKLQAAGHQVLGQTRSAEKAKALEALGVTPLVGDLTDAELLASGVAASQAVISLADSDSLPLAQGLISAMAQSGKTLIHTSGSSIVVDDARGAFASDATFDDDAPFTPMDHRLPRVAVDRAIRLAGIEQGLRTAVICPTMVYGQGPGVHGVSDQIPKIAAKSLERGAGVYVGQGQNIWSNVHVDDLADLFLLALERAPSGAFFFAENGEASLKSVAEAVSRQLGLDGRTESWDLAEAEAELGPWPRVALATNCRVRATNARRALGWTPRGPALQDAVLVTRA